MDILAIQAAVPIAEEASATHALLVREVVECRRATWFACTFNVDDLLARRQWRGNVGQADTVDI